jgi:hypothetical protein
MEILPSNITLESLLLENLNCPTYKLTTEQQADIQNFIQKSPELLQKITTDINTIKMDGKIDIYDIPSIVQLLIDTYQLYSLDKTFLQSENVIIFIQYAMNVIIDSDFVVLPEFEKQIIERVVNNSIQLLQTTIDKKKISSFFCCK